MACFHVSSAPHNQEVYNYKIAARPDRRRQFEKELTSQMEVALSILTACLNINELKEQVGFFNHKNRVLYLKFGHRVFLLINRSCSIFICLGFMDISGARGICFLASIKAWVCLFFMSLFLHNILDSILDSTKDS